VVFRGEFVDVSPLTASKPLEDENEDERERKILEEAKA
jgi:hypothetical protein